MLGLEEPAAVIASRLPATAQPQQDAGLGQLDVAPMAAVLARQPQADTHSSQPTFRQAEPVVSPRSCLPTGGSAAPSSHVLPTEHSLVPTSTPQAPQASGAAACSETAVERAGPAPDSMVDFVRGCDLRMLQHFDSLVHRVLFPSNSGGKSASSVTNEILNAVQAARLQPMHTNIVLKHLIPISNGDNETSFAERMAHWDAVAEIILSAIEEVIFIIPGLLRKAATMLGVLGAPLSISSLLSGHCEPHLHGDATRWAPNQRAAYIIRASFRIVAAIKGTDSGHFSSVRGNLSELAQVAKAAQRKRCKQLLANGSAFLAALADHTDQEVTLQNLNDLFENTGHGDDWSSWANAPSGIFSSERGIAAVLDPAPGLCRPFGVLLSAVIFCTDPGWYHGCEMMVQRGQPVWLTMYAIGKNLGHARAAHCLVTLLAQGEKDSNGASTGKTSKGRKVLSGLVNRLVNRWKARQEADPNWCLRTFPFVPVIARKAKRTWATLEQSVDQPLRPASYPRRCEAQRSPQLASAVCAAS